MIKIKREEHDFILMDSIKAIVKELKPHTYKVYVDLTDGEMYLTKGTATKPKFKFLGSIKLKEESTYKKFVNLSARSIYHTIRNYTNNGCLICRTTAVKTYGKEYIGTQDFYVETDNPYYKCADPMHLYNKDVLEYNIKNVA